MSRVGFRSCGAVSRALAKFSGRGSDSGLFAWGGAPLSSCVGAGPLCAAACRRGPGSGRLPAVLRPARPEERLGAQPEIVADDAQVVAFSDDRMPG